VLWLAALFSLPGLARADFDDHERGTFSPVFEASSDSMGAGVAFLDYDVDGWDDVAIVHGGSGVVLYRNEGPPDFTFTDVTPGSGLEGLFRNGVAVAATDVDRDGDPDVFFAERDGLHLYRNDGDGTFVEVTESALPGLPWYASTVAFADLDFDGWTDAYVAGYTLYLSWPFHDCAPSTILHNRGDGTFEDVTDAWGGRDEGCTLAVLASDYDRDGDADLFAANDFGQFSVPDSLLRNDGIGPDGEVLFEDVSESSGWSQRLYGMGIATADVNDDGWPDYFTTSIGRDVLLLGSADGTFTDDTEAWSVTSQFGTSQWRATWGTAFLDVEQDGAWDLYVASGYLAAAIEILNDGFQPNLLHGNLAAGVRSTDAERDVAPADGVAPEDAGKGVAIGDFDRDGADDILTAALGGDVHLYRNAAEPGAVVRVSLHGTVSTPEAWGTWVTLECDGVLRSRERDSGGSYGSAHGLEMRMPLAGCAAGGDLVVDWPSGATTRVAVDDATGDVSLDEPEIVRLDRTWVRADGATEAVATIAPVDDSGASIGAGHVVGATTTFGTIGPVTDAGDGTYETRLRSGAQGDALLTITVDGAALRAHPRVHFGPAAADPTTISLSPSGYVAGTTDVVVTVVPRMADGSLEGAGAVVDLALTRGSVVLDPVDEGDGTYRAVVHGDGGGPLGVEATVDGVARGSASLPEVIPVDPDRTRAWADPGYYPPLELAIERANVVVSPRTSEGDISSGFEGLDYRLYGSGGDEIPIEETVTRSTSIQLLASAQDVYDQQPVRLEIDGVPIAKPIELVTYDDPADLLDYVDPAHTRIGPFMQTAYADGQDYDWVVVSLKDDDGDIVPSTDLVSFESDLMTPVERRLGSGGREMRGRLRVGLVPGRADVDVLIDGAETGVSTWITLLGEVDHDLDRVCLQMCLDDVYSEADGDGNVRVTIVARYTSGYLVGSNLPLRLEADGADISLDYTRPSQWWGYVPVAAKAGRTTVVASMDGTDSEATAWIEFFPPLEPPGDLGLPQCVDSCDPVELEDAGPLDASPDADSGSDVDVDVDVDGDAAPDAAPDAAVHVFHVHSGGCDCDCSATGRPDPGLALFLLYPPLLRSLRSRSKR
jgi:hypothetical protein